MNELYWILVATSVVSLISFIGAITLLVSEKRLKNVLLVMVGFSAGSLMGGAFFNLLPEAIGRAPSAVMDIFLSVILGFVVFFAMEKLLWRHCHERECPIHTFAYLNLFGDGVHNFIDGLVIAASFVVSIPLGAITTLAVAAHEVPQEMSDFGVIVYGGIKPARALYLNFLTAVTAIVGGLTGYYLFQYIGPFMIFLLPFTAGGFLYIAASDLVPELHKETGMVRTVASFASFLAGIFLMWGTKFLFGG